MLAKAVDQSAKMLDVPPSSRASPLPLGVCGSTKPMVNAEHCRSELARESGGSVGKDVGCAAAFASKLGPNGDLWRHQINGQHENCGSELARESGGSVGKDVGMCRRLREQARSYRGFVAAPNHWSTQSIVGASLLAKAVDQSVKMLDVPPSSRASSLSQGVCGSTKTMVNAEHCRSEPARESGESVGKDVGCAAVFASKPAPTGGLWQHQTNGQRRTLQE